MELRIDGDPRELPEKATPLLKSLAEKLAPLSADAEAVLELLEKAEEADPQPRDPLLQRLIDETSRVYRESLQAMQREISDVLDERHEIVEKADRLPGGKGDKLKPEDVDARQLAEGIKHELEHTKDRALAQEIALDHLAEDPKYYTKLKEIEKAAGAAVGTVHTWSDGRHMQKHPDGRWKPVAQHSKPGAATERETAPPPPSSYVVRPHPKLGGTEREVTYRVIRDHGAEVTLSRHKDSDYGPTMPKASVKHFVNDLAGVVDVPPNSGNKYVDAVSSGKAEFLGKGDDGLAFRVGDMVVKVSTTVPYQPENPGHRTPEAAADMLRQQVAVGNDLATHGVRGIQRSEFVLHGDKGFQIKPYVEIPDKWTRPQLDKIQDTLIAVHQHGYALNDEVQAGLGADGEPVLFDVGKAAPLTQSTGIFSDIDNDMDRMRYLYQASGEAFVRRDVDEAMQDWQKITGSIEKRIKNASSPKGLDFIRYLVDRAADKRRAHAKATLQGAALEDALEAIGFEHEDVTFDVEANRDRVTQGWLLQGNAGIPRIDMPQIPSKVLPDFLKGLDDDRIGVHRGVRKVREIKATQSELHMDKVREMQTQERANLLKPVIISKDGFLLDGHHRWAALVLENPDNEIPVVQVDLPIKSLLARAKKFSGAEFRKSGLDDYEEELLKAERSHKYIRRTPTGDTKRPWRYYYTESASARAAREGEDIRVKEHTLKITKVEDDGTIHYEHSGEAKKVSADAWTSMMIDAHGEQYLRWAERRARTALDAVAKHVSSEQLRELQGETDRARLADLKTRVPEIYEKLRASFHRAGMSPHAAKRMLAFTLERRGWHEDARAHLIGSVFVPGGAEIAKSYREISRGAENLAGAREVAVPHVAAAIELQRPNEPDGDYLHEVAQLAKSAERELAKLTAAIARAKEHPGAEAAASVLAEAMAATAMAKLQLLQTAYPGLKDRALEPVREAFASVTAISPRTTSSREGAQTTVFVAGEGGQPKAIRAQYRLIEAGVAIPSHNPQSFRPNSAYPENIQERAYHRDPGEQDKVRRNAQRMNPEFVINTNPDAVNGPPMLTTEGFVLGGNSRTMSMQRIYTDHPEKAAQLKSYLEANAHQFGFKPTDVAALEHPMLVREVDVEDKSKENLQLLVRQMNESFTQAMDPRTMQVAMGRRLTDKSLESLAHGMRDDETLSEFLSSPRAEGFVSQLFNNGIIDERNSNQYITKGTRRLNSDGQTFVERILVGRIVESADVLSETRPSTVSSVARAIPFMVQAEAHGAGYAVRNELRTALDALADISHLADTGAIKMPDAKTSTRDFEAVLDNLRQLPGMGGDHPVLTDARAKAMLKVLIYHGGPKQMSAVFKTYAKLAEQNPEGQRVLFGEPVTPAEVFDRAVAHAGKHQEPEAQGSMFKAEVPPGTVHQHTKNSPTERGQK
jgi:hypothetical protein